MNTKTRLLASLTITLSLLLTACKKDDSITKTAILSGFNKGYVAIVQATYDDTYTSAQALHESIVAFVANPTEEGLDVCKTQWLASRNPYGQTEAFRFYGGPIDDENGPEGLINAWPIDESFIDYVQGNLNSGLINDPVTYPVITKDLLVSLNESISETSIFTGYHAIEFLLWGQDFNASGPGGRPYTDYLTGSGATSLNGDRRGTYLLAISELLLDNLSYVRDSWKPEATYAKNFLANQTQSNLELVFTSLGELSKGELAGERMIVAVDSDDQENEHSCFSDNTVADIRMNFLGIKNLLNGQYTRVDGSVVSGRSLLYIGLHYDSDKATKVATLLTETEALINQIPSPFDQAILYNKGEIVSAAQSLRNLSDAIADMGFSITTLKE
jgi:putative iron-regulated protein